MKRLKGGRCMFNPCVMSLFNFSVFPLSETILPLSWPSLYCSHLTAEESDSDSDEDLEGGVRHDLMMADEKVQCTWWCKNHLFLSKQNSTKECARQWLNNVEWQNSPAHVVNNHALANGPQMTSLLCHQNIPYLTTVIRMCSAAYVTGLSEVGYHLSELGPVKFSKVLKLFGAFRVT